MPNICGVAVVCNGGGNPVVANEIINMISSAFGVPKSKIYVTEGKN
jgi:stage III sporulation protein AG